MTQEEEKRAKHVDMLRGFENLTQEERIAKLEEEFEETYDALYVEEYLQSPQHYCCENCNIPNRYYNIVYQVVPKEVYTEGICYTCKQKKQVFHTFLYRHIVKKYGFIIEDWEKSKFQFHFLK